ncbi:uncharacterized protein si:ch211-14k19.8 [Syngnathus typhle]|uniref:uncharacterized protein si:ch211-14k19.8 n=1 Tax=Syngnathus typhle TaxID=161592 RepID=UPI002A6A34BD|nr:uncharacterized protein si:ch211-14k19.8 [Syngnathus typhle]
MQLFHVCLVLAAAVVTTVQEEPRNSTEEPHSDRVFHSPSQAGSDDTSTQEPSGSESGPATPLTGSGSHDSEALQLPEEVGNNGAETSVSHLPETLVLTLETQTNPGMPEGTRGAHTSGRSAFPPVTSAPTRWARLATPAGTTDTIYLQKRGRTSSNEMFRKHTPVLGSTWSRTDLSQSTPKTPRLPDGTEGTARFPGSTWTTRDASMVSGRTQNSSGLEDETGTPRLWSRTSAKTDYVDGMGTTQVLGLGGSPIRTSTPVFSTSSRVLDLSDSKNQTGTPPNTPQAEVLRVGFSENGTERSGLSTHVSTFLSSREVPSSSVSTASSEDVTGRSRDTTQEEVLDLGLSQDVMATPEIPPGGGTILPSRVQTFSGSEAATIGQLRVSSVGDTEDTTGTPGDFFHGQTETASARVLGFGGSRNTDDTLYATPTTLKNPAVSPSLLDVLTQAYPTPTQITQETLVTEEKIVTTRQLIVEVQSASTPLSSATTRVPKVYVVPDQAATIRVETIELLLQIIVEDSSSASGPDLEKETGAWVEPYLRKAPGFRRMLAAWGSGRAVQMLLEFHSVGALLWLSASGASSLLRRTGLDEVARRGRSFRGSEVVNVTLGGLQADVCHWLLGCPAGFRCLSGPANNYSCSSDCHFDFCHHHGVCTHHPGQLPVCRCLVGEDFWFMGSRCDVRMTRARLVCTCASILVVAVAVIGTLAFVAVRRYRAALIQAKVDQTRSSYRRFNHFDELSSRFWPRSASAPSVDSMDNPAFTRSDELLHMRALDRPCCYHDDTLSLASASASSACTSRAAPLNTIYPDSSQYGWCGSELSTGDGVLDSGKASDLSVCSWPVEPIHWTPFPLLRQLAAPRTPHSVRTSRPRSYCEGMELVDMNRSWTA